MHASPGLGVRFAQALAASAIVLLALAGVASAATRETLLALNGEAARAFAPIRLPRHGPAGSVESRAGEASSRADADSVDITSDHYGPGTIAAIRADLESLPHGPELARLSVFVATPAEVRSLCGSTVIACYLPDEMRMVVSGSDRRVGGVSRRFAIAHEYGHHIANTQSAEPFAAIDAGTIRWATYERVCQLTRSRRLFPGNQGAHYWQDPEEAFADSYARLGDPGERVSWQYSSLLSPTPEALGKIRADLQRPWTGPVTYRLRGSLAAPSASSAPGRNGRVGLGPAERLGGRSSEFLRYLKTPLDGRVGVTVSAPAGTGVGATLSREAGGATVASAKAGPGGTMTLAYSNCGNEGLWLRVRSTSGAGEFEATVTRP